MFAYKKILKMFWKFMKAPHIFTAALYHQFNWNAYQERQRDMAL
jgi:hypothetical protein